MSPTSDVPNIKDPASRTSDVLILNLIWRRPTTGNSKFFNIWVVGRQAYPCQSAVQKKTPPNPRIVREIRKGQNQKFRNSPGDARQCRHHDG